MLATSIPGATWPDGALKAPLPYFGGKHAVAAAVWARLGPMWRTVTWISPHRREATSAPVQYRLDFGEASADA